MLTRPLSLPSPHFVESCGALPFHLPTRTIALVYYKRKDEYLLAKGRRNISESRSAAALREVREETGLTCTLLPVTMETRAPPADEKAEETNAGDRVRVEEECVEPFMMSMREVGRQGKKGQQGSRHLKIIWWFLGEIVEGEGQASGESFDEGRWDGPEEQFDVVRVGVEEAVEKLSFEGDREVLRKGVELVKGTYWSKEGDSREGVIA
ncbi:hypothetical protein BU16DRAFT_255118 [Lophium mytilinum]|uniref:Uncharacterized protein n=1 Tax=Lophium mytilinum TaxID=390894 RepID=A0A6A6R875_9PEZI|nr:hypothetical protein BU16DRAFT_255118 [Lophium mytilinum]